MEILRTATGKEYYCDHMGKASELILYVKISIDPYEALSVFQKPEETNHLQWINTKGEVISEEFYYTKFVSLTMMGGDCPVRIRLEKDLDALIRQKAAEMIANNNQ